MRIKNLLLFLLTLMLFSKSDLVTAGESAGNKGLTLKDITEKISYADNPNEIKLRLNSGSSDHFENNGVKIFSGMKTGKLFSENSNYVSDKPDHNSPDLLKNVSTKYLDKNVDINKYFPEEYRPWEADKHFGLAVIDEVTFNILIPWALARYTRDWSDSGQGERWPFIGFQSIWSNFQNGWNYDGDNFVTNMFSHPYGGNLFFNSGRSNGYNFWESSAFAFAGSFIWETFMETNQPAINDWVITGMNGTTFGEILFRIATLITDNTATGGHRVWTEAMGGIVSPVRFFTRLVTGEASRVFKNPSWRTPKNLDLKFDAGTRVLTNDTTKFKELEGIFDLTMEYGNQYKDKHKTPFSYFMFNLAFSSNSPNLTSMNSIGSLLAFQIYKSKTAKHNLETTTNFNYLNNPGFLYGNASIVEQLNSLYKLGKGWTVRTKFGVKLIPMGGTPDDYFLDSTDGRNYDMGQGLGALGNLTIHKGNWEIFTIDYDMDYIWTQSEPSFSKHFLQGGTAIFQLPITDYFAMGLSVGYYKRKSYYNYPSNFYEFPTPDVSFQTPILKVFFRTKVI